MKEKVRPIGDLHSVPHFRCGRCHDAVVVYNHDKRPRKCPWCGTPIDWRPRCDMHGIPELTKVPKMPIKYIRFEGCVMEKWVSVNDRLPEYGHRVLLSFVEGGVGIGRRLREENVETFSGIVSRDIWEDDDLEHDYGFDKVNAWMPLPESYKLGGEK